MQICPPRFSITDSLRQPSGLPVQNGSCARSANRRTARGLTIVEMLISLVCVILLMFAYTQLFSDVGGRIGDARSMIELTHRMQTASQRLRTDLDGHTCNLLPWQDPASDSGYFEIIEGPLSDQNPGLTSYAGSATYALTDPSVTPSTTYPMGDTDDVLMFTVRSKDQPFTGLYNGQTVQSQVAEVVWFLRPTMLSDGVTPVSPPTFTLYRRVFLVMPTYRGSKTTWTTGATPASTGLQMPPSAFYQNNDISAHIDESTGTPVAVANTLGDLTKRECRFGHAFINNAMLLNNMNGANGFPHCVYPPYLVPLGGSLSSGTYSVDTTNNRYGQDVVLTNVVSFDVQVWDPTAPIYLQPTPSTVTNPSPYSMGAFVDLNWLKLGWSGTSNVTWGANSVSASSSQVSVVPGDLGFPYQPTLTRTLADLAGSTSITPTSPPPMTPFYSTGDPQSKLLGMAALAGSTAPTDFTKNWLFDDHLNANGLPDYGTYGFVPATFDTWSTSYEHDGLNQNAGGDVTVQGFNQMNNTETAPPYPVALRGVKVTIRCYEPDSRQVHEISVVESFVPQ